MKTNSITFRIFFSTVVIGILVYFVCVLILLSNMYNHFEKQIFSELETESSFLEIYIQNSDFNGLEKIAPVKNRITLIHDDGTVFFDNKVSPEKMENHALRKEFLKAKENGRAKVSRFSSTMMVKTLYFAKVLPSGDILRISCEQRPIVFLMFEFEYPLFITLVAALIISGIAASWTSKKIVEPLNKIDLENPENSDSEIYEELKPFTRRIAKENFEKSQREELRKQFSANVSHELKTPLTSISGFAEILAQGETDKKTAKDFAATIYDESQRMITLVNDIIKLSKLDEKSIVMEKEPLSLLEIAEEAKKALSSSARAKNVKIYVSGDSENILGVRPVIYEMIFNLIDNAIKYNRDGGNVDVEIKNTLISVSDTGIGIPENEQERIFERFYRVDKSRSKALGGTGLGLSIVKHAAKYHDAKITLVSKEGSGSKFSVEF